MSKRQALLETLLGAAELSGNRLAASDIRGELLKLTRSHEDHGYQQLLRAASEPRRPQSKAA